MVSGGKGTPQALTCYASVSTDFIGLYLITPIIRAIETNKKSQAPVEAAFIVFPNNSIDFELM